jgi:Activator of Hsp90 ATPase homolog 1-like protein
MHAWRTCISLNMSAFAPPEPALRSRAGIQWPERFRPDRCPVWVSNSRTMPIARRSIWHWLIRAESWPRWYPNSSNVVVSDSPQGVLRPGAEFRWRTFGVSIRSTVVEFHPEERIAWTGKCAGLEIYHAWLLEVRGQDTYVLTEETQHGWLARLGHFVSPLRMHRGHALWLESLESRARRETD